MENTVSAKLNAIGFEQMCTSKDEVLNFIHNLEHQDHCILIFQDEQERDNIVKEFINPKYARNSVTACFSNNSTKYDCNHQISYDSLIQEQKFQPHVVSDFLLNVLANSYGKDQARIACEETSWLAEHGVFDEHQDLGNKLDERVVNESTIMCCYNESKLDEQQMSRVLSSRKYVILENPFSVYMKKE